MGKKNGRFLGGVIGLALASAGQRLGPDAPPAFGDSDRGELYNSLVGVFSGSGMLSVKENVFDPGATLQDRVLRILRRIHDNLAGFGKPEAASFVASAGGAFDEEFRALQMEALSIDYVGLQLDGGLPGVVIVLQPLDGGDRRLGVIVKDRPDDTVEFSLALRGPGADGFDPDWSRVQAAIDFIAGRPA